MSDLRARFALQRKLESLMGAEDAMTLLHALPPPGTRVATRDDVEALGRRLDQRMDGLEQRMDLFEQRMDLFEQRMDRFEHQLDRLADGLDRVGDQIVALHGLVAMSTRTYMYTTVGALIALAGVAFTAAFIAR